MSNTIITLYDNTEMLLEHWGRWARGGVASGLGFDSAACFVADKGGKSCGISDEDAMIIDSALSALKRKQPELLKAIVKRYRYKMSFAKIGREMNVSNHTAKNYHDCGVAWVDGRLEANRYKLVA